VTELEELFGAWAHQVYHQAVHSETGQAPAGRFAAAPTRLRQLAPQVIEEAFLWQDFRTVTKTATISLHGNRYQVDAALSGRKVELLYNPADLAGRIRVRWRGTDMGEAVPHVIGRHSHPGLAPAAPAPAAPTGIDYLRIVAEAHRHQQAGSINFAALAEDRHQDAAGGGDEAGPGETR
jgi:putative transposase